MTISFTSASKRRTWMRLLELDSERCFAVARRRRDRLLAAHRARNLIRAGGDGVVIQK
jgi:hypothetical protein